jgi:hypothetical protein
MLAKAFCFLESLIFTQIAMKITIGSGRLGSVRFRNMFIQRALSGIAAATIRTDVFPVTWARFMLFFDVTF